MSLAVLGVIPVRAAACATGGTACAIAVASSPSLRGTAGLLVKIVWLYIVNGARG